MKLTRLLTDDIAVGATAKRAARRHLRFLAFALGLFLIGCEKQEPTPEVVTAKIERGRVLLRQYGCGTCHTIPGVIGAAGKVGPPLDDIGKRLYLGGVLPNTMQNMVRWIRAPQEVDPPTAMPDLQVSQSHAEAMAAYLQRLRER